MNSRNESSSSKVHQNFFFWNEDGQLEVVEDDQDIYESYVSVAKDPNKALAWIGGNEEQGNVLYEDEDER